MAAIPFATAHRITEQLVGVLDSQEARRVGLRRIRVEALGQAPMGGLDLGRRRLAAEAEDPVWIRDALHDDA
jgi:hypothetical protein